MRKAADCGFNECTSTPVNLSSYFYTSTHRPPLPVLEGYYSFSRQGDIKRLEKSKKYVPGYLEVERIQEEARRIGEEIGEKKGKQEIAKEMKKEGESVEKISKYTGLSREEIEQLK